MNREAIYSYIKKKKGLFAADGGQVPDFVSQSSQNDDAPAIDLNSDIDVTSTDPNKNYVEQASQNPETSSKPAKAKDDKNPFEQQTDSPAFKFSRTNPAAVQNFMNVMPLNAADGGEVPGDEDESEDDSSDETEAPAAPSKPSDDAAPTDDAKQAAIKDYLMKQYADAADDKNVKDAQAEQARSSKIADLGQSLTQMATARATANGYQQDNGVFQHIRDQGKQGVEQAQVARQQAINGFLQKNAIERQVVQGKMASEDHQTKMDAAAAHAALSAPGTPAAQARFTALQQLFPKETQGLDPKTMSVNDIGDFGKQLDVKAKIEGNKALKAQAYAMGQGARDKKAADKTTADQRKAFLEMENKGMGGRGAPQYVTKNMVTQQSIANAQKMLDSAPKGPDGKPDYNQLTDKQIHLFNGELEKIATNGSPTESGRDAMDANTLMSKWQELLQRTGGKPRGAQVGEFVQQNAEYLQGLKESVDSTVNKFRRENFDNYYTAGALSDDHAEKYKAKHPELFPEEQQPQPGQAPVGGAGPISAKPQPAPHGDTVVQGGVTFKWNGLKYEEAPATAGVK